MALLEILPYGEEFLFLDHIVELDSESATARYRVPFDSPFARAHFRDLPIMPGVLTGEGLAQAGTLVVRQHLPDSTDRHVLALRISDAEFKGIARPGDEILFRVRLLKFGSKMARLEGEAEVNNEVIARSSFVLAIVSKAELQSLK